MKQPFSGRGANKRERNARSGIEICGTVLARSPLAELYRLGVKHVKILYPAPRIIDLLSSKFPL